MSILELEIPTPIQEIVHSQIRAIRVFDTLNNTATAAAAHILNIVTYNPQARITYATGKTMIPVYEYLEKLTKARGVSFATTWAAHLDEYYPCAPTAEHSFVRFLREKVFEPLGIPIENRRELDGLADDPLVEASRYEALIAAQPVDLAILGVGPGGHIAFNEQGSAFDSRTRLTTLAQDTLVRDQARGQQPQEYALTQGIATILDAREIILVAYGSEKGLALRDALYGAVGINSPVSALRLHPHTNIQIYIDKAAASQLKPAI